MVKKEITVESIFAFISIIGILFAFISILFSYGDNWRFLLWNGDSLGIFPDLFESIGHAISKQPYDNQAIYPAFAYLVCFVLGKLIPAFDYADWYMMSTTGAGVVVSFLFYFFCVLILKYIIEKVINENQITKNLVIILFVCSPPFIYMLERGNMVILSLVGCMFFIFYCDSQNVYLRHLSYMAIAMAAALKIYPAVLGLLIIKKRNLKEVVCLLIYGLLVFMVPFFFFGGFTSIGSMLKNAFSLSDASIASTRGFGYGYKVNIHNFFAAIAEYTDSNLGEAERIVTVALIVFLIVSSFLCREKWKKVTCLCLLLTIIPTFSWIYNAIYMLPPFVLFLKENGYSKNLKSFVFLFLFLGIFIPLPYRDVFSTLEGVNKMSLSTFSCSISSYFLVVMMIYDGLKMLLKGHFFK